MYKVFFKITPSNELHIVHHSCHFWKTSDNPFLLSTLHHTSTAIIERWFDSNLSTHGPFLISENSQKSHAARSGLYEGCGTVWIAHFFQKFSEDVCNKWARYRHDAKEFKNFFNLFVRTFFFFWNGRSFFAGLLGSTLLQQCGFDISCADTEQPLHKKNYPNLSSTTHNFGFFLGLAMSKFFIINSVILILIIMKHSGLILSYHITKFSLSLALKPHA